MAKQLQLYILIVSQVKGAFHLLLLIPCQIVQGDLQFILAMRGYRNMLFFQTIMRQYLVLLLLIPL